MLSKKNIKVGNLNKLSFGLIIFISMFIILDAKTENNLIGNETHIKILDKISSKNELVTLSNGGERIYKDLAV